MKFVPIKGIADRVFQIILGDNIEAPAEAKAYLTGNSEYRFYEDGIDNCIGTLKAGEVYTVASRPGMGKTSLLINTAVQNALHGKQVYVITLEADPYMLTEMIIPIITGLDNGELDDASYNAEHRETMLNAWSIIRALPIFFATHYMNEDFTSTTIIGNAAKENISGGLILVDYIQLLTLAGIYPSQQDRTAAAAVELKQIAEECNSPLIVTSQLSRGVEARADRMPRISDINEGLRVVSYASMVLFRENFYNNDAKPGFTAVMKLRQADEECTAVCKPFYKASSKRTDRLGFKLADPRQSGEEWAMKLQNAPKVAEIYINGKELISIVKKREAEIKAADDLCESGSYGHLSAKELYKWLTDAQTGQSEFAHLLCCDNCGDSFCWAVRATVTVGWKYVTWTLSHNHRDWKYDLTYRFDKKEYMRLIEKLSGIAFGDGENSTKE